MPIWDTYISPALKNMVDTIIGIFPKFLAALSILILGWILARIVRKVFGKLLDKLGFNTLVEKAGIAGFLQRSGFLKPPSWIIAQMIFWLIMLSFMLSAAESLEMNALVAMLQRFVAFIPNLITVAFILVFGIIAANFLGKLIQGAADGAGIEFANVLGKLVSNILIIAIFVVSVSQLDIEASVLLILFASLLGAFGLAIALTLGLGSRIVSQNIISGMYVRKSFEVGQEINLRETSGEIVEIGTVNTTVKTKDDLVILPNHILLGEITRVKKGKS